MADVKNGSAAEKKSGDKKEKPADATPKHALQFSLPKKLTGERTLKQIRSYLNDNLVGYGPLDEVKVTATEEGYDIVVIFMRVLAKGQLVIDALAKGEPARVSLYDTSIDVNVAADAKSSGGGRASGTASKKPPPKAEGRGGGRGGRGRGGRGGRGGRDGFGDDGGRGRGRGRGGGGRGRGRGPSDTAGD